MMNSEGPIIREMLGNERKFLWSPVANVALVAEIEGRVDREEFKRTLEKMKIRHPLLACRVSFDSSHNATFVRDKVPEIPVRYVDGNEWLNVVLQEYRIPFQPEIGPLCRFIVVERAVDTFIVVFCQHSICDGTGLMHLLGDILKALNDPEAMVTPCPLPVPLSPESLPAAAAPSKFMMRLQEKGIAKINKSWNRNPFLFDQQDYETIHKAYWQKFEYRLLFLELDRHQTRRLVDNCRSHQVTVNSALCAAFLGAHRDVCGGFKGARKNVAIPVDLRNRVEPKAGGVLSLYVGSLNFPFQYNPKRGFWENAAGFHKIVTRKMENQNLFETFFALEALDHTLLEAMLTFAVTAQHVPANSERYQKLSTFGSGNNQAVKMGRRFTKSLPGMVMTNLGKVPIPVNYYSFRLKKMYFLPSTSESFPLALGVVTTDDQLVLTINYVDLKRKNELTRIREKAVQLLELGDLAYEKEDQ